ncbi:MAG: hypothetical protein HQL86_00865 [Magnetococcales bacterium]|nr:hypothetical protein [Magnetococcales bacterium]
MSGASPCRMQRIAEAQDILGLGEKATLAAIEARAKTLLKRETVGDDSARYRDVLGAEEVDKYPSPAEWMAWRFGARPCW